MSNFASTRWSLIQQAVDQDSGLRNQAWKEFDTLYRSPLLGYIRKAGWNSDEAEDLLQSFFAKLTKESWLEIATPDRGKMRTFLINKLRGHLSDARKYENALRRGGGEKAISLESVEEISIAFQPTLYFDRQWAYTILNRVILTLEKEFDDKKQSHVFSKLRPSLTGDSATTLKEVALEIGKTEGALAMELHRLRERFRSMLRSEVAQTLMPGEDLDEELRYLSRILSTAPEQTSDQS